MSNDKNPTCAERIDSAYTSRMDAIAPDFDEMELAQLVKLASDHGVTLDTPDEDDDEDDITEAARETIRDAWPEVISGMALGVSTMTVYRVDLSCGGPADWLELNWDGDGWDGGRYVYQDWYDSAARRFDSSTAERIADAFGIYPDAN